MVKRQKTSIALLALISTPMLLLFTNCASISSPVAPVVPICFQYVFANDLEKLKQFPNACVNFETENHITTLMMASSKGHKEIVQFLITNGATLETKNRVGHTALAFAVLMNKPEIVKLLITNGAQISSDSNGISVVMMAIQFDRPEVLKILNPNLQDVNLKANDGWTAIYFSIRSQDMAILDYLFDKGACPNVIDTYSQSPLDFANEGNWTASFSHIRKAKLCDALTANP